jgi:NDP-sugar pyrophosphorylase family protein
MFGTNELNLKDFVNLSLCLHNDQFQITSAFNYVGKSLGEWLEDFLTKLGVTDSPVIKGNVEPGAIVRGRVYIDAGATVEPTAFIQGPCYIGPGSHVRHGAYIRGQVYVGKDCVVGHATETKGSAFFDGAKAGHFAYVGDSILGRNVNLGAGTKLANLALNRHEIRVRHPHTGHMIDTGLTKFSAILGDDSQTGCNAVLSPGTLLMPGTSVLPCVHYRGTLVTGSIRKSIL